MPEVQNTTYLSIGEVLGLLLAEFPDITISKIRFLESQGLIAPERTPSGYRKFYEPDVELLKVILREQRENYLPLRVIKDRIDSGAIDPSGEMTKPDGLPDIQSVTARTTRCRPTRLPNEHAERDVPNGTVHDTRHDTDDETDEHATTTEPTSTNRRRSRGSGGDDRRPSGFEPIVSRHHRAVTADRRRRRCRVGARRERPRRPHGRRRRSCSPGCCSRAPSCAR